MCFVRMHYLRLWSLRGECVLSLAFMLAREDEVHLHAPLTKTEHFWLCVWANRYLEIFHHCQETTYGP
jgi:hypothetical protein